MKFKLEMIYPAAKTIRLTKNFNTTNANRGWSLAKKWADKVDADNYEKTKEFFNESNIERVFDKA